MKQQFILWASAIILTFLFSYIRNVTDEFYAVTGTFSIEGKRISYKLDKVHYGKEPYKILILTDLGVLEGKCVWKSSGEWITIPLIRGENNLYANIPFQKPISKINYNIVLNFKDKIYEIPTGSNIEMTFYGKIPPSVNILNLILLYGGLMLAIRTKLEIFNKKKYIKKYIVITNSIFIVLTTIINPLRNSYKLDAINNYIPTFTEIIEPLLIALVFLWIAGSVLIFYKRFAAVTMVLLFISTLIIFYSLPIV